MGDICQLEVFCACTFPSPAPEGCMHPSDAGLGNVHFVTNIFVLDICGQHLGDICQLEVFCAPFGRRVRECIFFCNVYIGYMLPTFGEQMSVDFIHCPRAQLSGGPNGPLFQGGQLGPGAQLSGAQLSRGPTVRGPTVRGPNCPGPNCPGAQLSGAQLSAPKKWTVGMISKFWQHIS